MSKKLAAIIFVGIVIVAGLLAIFIKVSQGEDVYFETVEWQDFYSGYAEKQNVVVKGESDWRSLWNMAHANILPTPEPPQVNFSENMILGVFMGEKATGGYKIDIVKIVEEKDSLEVYIRETSPGENCFVAQVSSRPYHMVKTKTSGKTVNFHSEEVKSSCE